MSWVAVGPVGPVGPVGLVGLVRQVGLIRLIGLRLKSRGRTFEAQLLVRGIVRSDYLTAIFFTVRPLGVEAEMM